MGRSGLPGDSRGARGSVHTVRRRVQADWAPIRQQVNRNEAPRHHRDPGSGLFSSENQPRTTRRASRSATAASSGLAQMKARPSAVMPYASGPRADVLLGKFGVNGTGLLKLKPDPNVICVDTIRLPRTPM